MPFELLPDPGYARLFGKPQASPDIVLAVRRDRALIFATMKREAVTVDGQVFFPLPTLVRCSEEGWWFWSRHAERLGLASYCPWWAQAALAVAARVRRVWRWFA